MDLVQQRSKGFATVLAIGTAVPPHKYSQEYMIDNYFRVTNTEHLTELKKKFAKICKCSFIYISFAIHVLHFFGEIIFDKHKCFYSTIEQ